MPNLIGVVRGKFFCVDVNKEVFKKVRQMAIKHTSNDNFIDKVFNEIINDGYSLSEKTVISYLERI